MKNLRIYLICGSPRSGTTWLHDSLITHNVFRGRVAEPLEHRSLSLQTNEYRPSMTPAVHYGLYQDNRSLEALREVIAEVSDMFAANGRLLLKAPHYVFCLDAYHELFGNNLRVLFIQRCPEAVCASMVRHPSIYRQLHRPPHRCGDFRFGRFITRWRRTPETAYAEPEVMRFARTRWRHLPLEDRALFKWHYFCRAYVHTAARLPDLHHLAVSYDAFDRAHGTGELLADFLDADANTIRKGLETFNPSKANNPVHWCDATFYELATSGLL